MTLAGQPLEGPGTRFRLTGTRESSSFELTQTVTSGDGLPADGAGTVSRDRHCHTELSWYSALTLTLEPSGDVFRGTWVSSDGGTGTTTGTRRCA